MKRQGIPMPTHPKPLNAKDIAIVEGLSRYWYLLPEQVERRYWRGKARSRAHAVLKMLTDRGYARTIVVPREETRGRPAWAYGLGPEGLDLLRTLGREVPPRLHLSRQPGQDVPQTLAVNDVLIGAAILERYQDAVILRDFIHEKTLHQKPHRVILPDSTRRGIEFDGVLVFDITDADGEFEQTALLEVDMGSKREYWTKKVETLVYYAESRYREDYGTGSFAYLVYTPKGERHMHNLISWTQHVLTRLQLDETGWPERFYFTCLPARTSDPVAFFLAPTWRQPFRTVPASPIAVHLG